jgi:hypothetical protein
MDIFGMALTVAGLCAFETISSIDNAVINAEVLGTMGKKGRRWFLTWGLFFGVFLVRGVLPWLIVWLATPGLGPVQALTATFSNDPSILKAVNDAAPILLSGGGTFLILLFFHWLFLETKNVGLPGERFFMDQGVWFYAVASVLLVVIVWGGVATNPYMALGTVIGSSAFFITHGFKEHAEESEKKLMSEHMSDVSKLFYLEAIDATFSIDGVLGAFAFTLAVPLIIIGNGLGAFVVRELTIRGADKIKRYAFLKNGAMYSILVLGVIMLAEAFGRHIPHWVSPVCTFAIIGFFFWKSVVHARQKIIL